MDVAITYSIAGLSTFALLVMWFANAYWIEEIQQVEVWDT